MSVVRISVRASHVFSSTWRNWEMWQVYLQTSTRKNMKDHNNIKFSGITFQCNQCDIAFTKKSPSRAHIQFVHKTFQFLCSKCTFKGNTEVYLDKHIMWILEGKGPQCELCHDMPTSKPGMTKHIKFMHGLDNRLNITSPLAVCVLSVERQCHQSRSWHTHDSSH